MGASSSVGTGAAKTELVITRLFDAPRSLVFKAWTQPEHMVHWWGPKGYTTPTCELDVRPGGALRLCMRSPEGNEFWVRGVFREVVEPERLVFTGADGKIGAGADSEADPSSETVMTITFAEQDGKTLLTVHQTFVKAETAKGAKEGWTSSLERLAQYLAQDLATAR
jgi:uncharacterized protein YndB with AHSA1/START domain